MGVPGGEGWFCFFGGEPVERGTQRHEHHSRDFLEKEWVWGHSLSVWSSWLAWNSLKSLKNMFLLQCFGRLECKNTNYTSGPARTHTYSKRIQLNTPGIQDSRFKVQRKFSSES